MNDPLNHSDLVCQWPSRAQNQLNTEVPDSISVHTRRSFSHSFFCLLGLAHCALEKINTVRFHDKLVTPGKFITRATKLHQVPEQKIKPNMSSLADY